MRTSAEVTVGHQPDAVPRARRFARSSLQGEPSALVADAELVVSELVTNAALHGKPPICVRLVRMDDRLRVEVEDAGFTMPTWLLPGQDAPTGRGLPLVSSLSSAWGVDEGRFGGKVVWAELSAARFSDLRPVPPEVDPAVTHRIRSDSGYGQETFPVVIGPVPTRLLLDAKSHLEGVVRELTLMRAGESSGRSLPPEISLLVRTVTVDFSYVRAELKRRAAAASAQGRGLTDLELHLPLSAADVAQRYLLALAEVDRYARSAKLLTLASPPSYRVFREWYLHAIIDQLHAAAHGDTAVPPEPLAFVMAKEIDSWDPNSAWGASVVGVEGDGPTVGAWPAGRYRPRAGTVEP